MALIDYYNTGDNANIEITTTYWRGQSFTASQSYSIGSVRLLLYRSTATSGNVVVYLYNADGAGKPTGSPLTSGSIPISDLTYLTANWHTIYFDSSVDLTSETQYVIMAKSTDSSFWARQDNDGGYDGGTFVLSNNGGSTWYTTSADLLFETYEAASSVDLSGSISGSGSVSGGLSVASLVDISAAISGTGSLSGLITIGDLVGISGSISGAGTVSGALVLLPNWKTQNFKTTKYLVAIGHDEVWSESVAGTLTQVTASVGDINTSDMLSAFEAYQKVFIVNGSNKKVLDFVNDKLTISAALTTPPLKGDTLTQATSGAKMIVDSVSADKKTIYGYRTTDATFDTTNTVSSDNAGGQTMDPATFTPATATSRSSGPLWYDWTKHPSKSTSLPTKLYLGCLYRGRCVVSGNPEDPHQWYMSRQADPFDFDYLANDAQSPVSGHDASAGKIGDIVRALIPFHDDYLIFGCANSIWRLDGDPADGGTLILASEREGIHGANSWCFDADNNLWFWGTSGICKLAPMQQPVCETAISLPNLLDDENIDPSQYRILMGYDHKRAGIFITITKLVDGSNSCYWYDLRTGGLFPETYPNECGAYSLFYYNSNDDGYSGLLVGCRDGYIRTWSNSAKDDDIGASDQAINSYVLMPVVNLGGEADRYGRLKSMTFVNAGGDSGGAYSDSDSINYSVQVGPSAEQVVERVQDGETPLITGTLSNPGRNNRVRQRARGGYLGLKLSNDAVGETWALERVDLDIEAKGRLK